MPPPPPTEVPPNPTDAVVHGGGGAAKYLGLVLWSQNLLLCKITSSVFRKTTQSDRVFLLQKNATKYGQKIFLFRYINDKEFAKPEKVLEHKPFGKQQQRKGRFVITCLCKGS